MAGVGPCILEEAMFRYSGKFTLLIMILAGINWAQRISPAGGAFSLTAPGESYLAPQWSPDGNQLAVAGANYSGIYLVNFPSGEIRTLTRESGAGYGFSWSPTGDAIAARTATYEKYIKHSEIILYNLDGSRKVLSEKQPAIAALPRWSSSGDHVYLKSGKTFQVYPIHKRQTEILSGDHIYLQNLEIYQRDLESGSETLLSAPGQRVLHLAISPDESQFVYATVGEQLWIANRDGSGRRKLGRGTAPTWSPDGNWVACMITEDDGHVFTGSDLLIYRISDGSVTELTRTPDVFEMHPDWSPDGQWIAFDNARDGRILVIEVEEK